MPIQPGIKTKTINKSATILDLVENKPNNQLILNILFKSG
ncbi:hypothetical protein FORC066_3085 [Yersinia enterocolitica]|nr:hypothetical protein FORC065_1399 [Yersinia enterocolitica]UXD30292.1 hypothetical protein FORC066_3085 [Yersinia enterocolitica]